MSYVVCLIHCIRIRIDLICYYVYLFQHYYTGAKIKTRLSDVVSVQIKKFFKKRGGKKF